MLSGCPRLYAFPDEVDAFPCKNHMAMIWEDPSLILGPPREKENTSDNSSKSNTERVDDGGKGIAIVKGAQGGLKGLRSSSRMIKSLGILWGYRE